MTEPLSSRDTVPKKTRRISGVAVFTLIVLGFIAFNYRPAVPTVYCNENTLATKPDIIMLGTWWCPYCYQARRYFHDNNIRYCEYDIEHSDDGKMMYDRVNGQGIPVLLIGNKQFNGFDERMVEKLIKELHAS